MVFAGSCLVVLQHLERWQENKRHQRLVRKAALLSNEELIQIALMRDVAAPVEAAVSQPAGDAGGTALAASD